MATFTLDDVRAAVSEEYAPLEITDGDTTYTFRKLHDLERDLRRQVMRLFRSIDSTSEDEVEAMDEEAALDSLDRQEDAITEILTLVGSAHAGKFVAAQSLPTKMWIFQNWSKATQVGEA